MEETLQVSIAMMRKKGDTADLDNYRPIALLNAQYKIYAAILQRRIANALDSKLQKTQYGFRQGKSTTQHPLWQPKDS